MSIDFRAQNIQTEKIIVSGDPDAPLDRTQLIIYPIQAQGPNLNQGEIADADLVANATSTDVFLYVSGAIGGKNGTTKGISVFGGDLHISGNLSIDGTGGGGGGFANTFIVSSSSLETPQITGALGALAITDVGGENFGAINNFVRFVATSPSGSPTVVVVPITFPVNPMPDRFDLNMQIFTGDNPPVTIQTSLGLMNTDNTKAWQIFHSIPTSNTYGPAMQVLEVDTGVVGAQWNWPDISGSNGIDVQAKIQKVSPFAAIPFVKIDANVGGFSVGTNRVHSIAYPLSKTTGSINAGWTGSDFDHPALICIYDNYVGDLDVFFSVEFLY